MANTLLTMTHYAKAVAREIQMAPFIQSLDSQWKKEWSGKKKGDTIQIQIPPKYATTSNLDISSDKQDIEQTEKSFTLNIHSVVAAQVSMKEFALDIERFGEMVRNLAKPAADSILEDVENQVNALAYKEFMHNFNTTTPGTHPTAISNYTDARAQLVNYGCKARDRKISITPNAMGAFINTNSGLFNPQQPIGKQYLEGEVSKAIGFDWIENSNCAQHTTGTFTTGSTPRVNGASQSGTTLATDGWAASTLVLKAGDVITIAGVNAVATKTGSVNLDLGVLAQHTVASDATSTAGGAATITLKTGTNATAGKDQNVSALPADNAVITPIGTEATAYRQNLIYVPKAVAFACVDMAIPKKAEDAAMGKYGNIAVTVVKDYDINTHQEITRIDFLGGFQVIYPEWGGRVWSPS